MGCDPGPRGTLQHTTSWSLEIYNDWESEHVCEKEMVLFNDIWSQWGRLKWPYAITRVTVHLQPHVWSGGLQVEKKFGRTWHWMSLLRPGLIKQHKPNLNGDNQCHTRGHIALVIFCLQSPAIMLATYTNKKEPSTWWLQIATLTLRIPWEFVWVNTLTLSPLCACVWESERFYKDYLCYDKMQLIQSLVVLAN